MVKFWVGITIGSLTVMAISGFAVGVYKTEADVGTLRIAAQHCQDVVKIQDALIQQFYDPQNKFMSKKQWLAKLQSESKKKAAR